MSKVSPKAPAAKQPDADAFVSEAQVIAQNNALNALVARKSLATTLVLGAALCLAIVLNILQFSFRPEPASFAITPDGRAIALVPLSDNVMPPEMLLDWSSRTVVSMYRLTFDNYRNDLQANEKLFTSKGFEGYVEGLKRSQYDSIIVKNKFVMSAVPTRTPVITNEGMKDGRKFYLVKVPVKVTLQSSDKVENQDLEVSLLVLRVSQAERPGGLAVQSTISRRVNG